MDSPLPFKFQKAITWFTIIEVIKNAQQLRQSVIINWTKRLGLRKA